MSLTSGIMFIFYCYRDHRDLHSFPTRRSSDLEMIGELAAGGRAILLISSELPELLALCDRVLVMSEGRLTANIARADATQEAIMSAAVPRSMQAVAA